MDQDKLNTLLDKFHANQLTEDERMLFLLYINKEEFTEQRELWLDGLWDDNHEIKSSQNNQEILRQILNSKPVLNIRRFIAYAAVLAVFISIGTYFIISTDGFSSSIKKENIIAGSSKAVLEYEDGFQVDLESDHSALVVGLNGVKYENGEVVHRSNTSKMAKLTIPKAGQYQVVLSDGTKVFLNAESSLRYPTVFDNSTREVILEGEGYFEVAKDPNKPFIVSTKYQKIRVLGTRFNVSAYLDEPYTKTTLAEGSVQILTNNNESNIILKPNQQAVYDNGQLVTLDNVDVEEYISWTKGEIMLTNLQLADVFKQLERWYDVSFVYERSKLSKKTAFGVLDRNLPLDDILKSLEHNYLIKFQVEGRRVIVIM